MLNSVLQDSHCYRQPLAEADDVVGRPKRHLELMLSSIGEAVFAHDVEGRLTYVNRPGHRLLAIPAYSALFERITAAMPSDLVFRGEDGGRLSGEELPWRIALRQGRPSEKFLRCLDPWTGGERWWLAKSMPLFETVEDFDYCVTVLEDVTESRALKAANERLARKIAETERLYAHISQQDVLFREVHHRVKNNLQLLSGMVTMFGLRFSGGEVTEALSELQHRIGAIGTVHELLYRQGKEAMVDLGEYVEAVAQSTWASTCAADRRIRLTVETVPCPAGMDTAIPIGLVLTEVLINAAKHAFPAGQDGKVRVSLRPAEGRWRLAVRDDGVGLSDGDTSDSGIGSGLIRALACQLGGEATTTTDQGTEFVLRFAV